jgi:hypothetical protein
MQTYILLFLLGWGITSTVINGSIFDGIRKYFLVKIPLFGKLFSCIRCLGFWIGFSIFIPLLIFSIIPPIFPSQIPVWISFVAMPIFQSNFGVIVESLVIFLVKGTKSNI